MRGVKKTLVILAFLLLVILFIALLRDELKGKQVAVRRMPESTGAETEETVAETLPFPVEYETTATEEAEVPEKDRIAGLAEAFSEDFTERLRLGDTEGLFLGLGTEKLLARTGKSVDRDEFLCEMKELGEKIPDGTLEIGKVSLLSDENGTIALINATFSGKEDGFLSEDGKMERDMIFVLDLDREMEVESWYLLEMTDGRYGAY